MLSRRNHAIRCLLVGYNGTGNTGSDIRLITAIDDVRAAFGDETLITVLSINPARTAAILPTDERIKVIQLSLSPLPFVFHGYYLAWTHDVTILIEGSTFTQSWSPWLLHAYIWSAQHALWFGNYAIAYAVDVGKLSPFHAMWTRRIVNQMSLVITRTEIARKRLADMGIKCPIIANTDTAFQYRETSAPPESDRPLIGIAPVEFYHWPVRLRLWDKAENRYRWPFSFRWCPERRQSSQIMIENYVQLISHILQHHDCNIKLIAMEDVDSPTCDRIFQALPAELRERVSIITSRQAGPDAMVSVLRSLDALVTSRYHACVLSMEAGVPQMAVGHDERLESIYSELGMNEEYLLDYRQPMLAEKMIKTFDSMIENRQKISRLISEMLESRFRPLCMKNQSDLRNWGQSVFDCTEWEENVSTGSTPADDPRLCPTSQSDSLDNQGKPAQASKN